MKNNSILESLKKIYTKMTGKRVVKRKTETDVLSDIAEFYDPSQSGGGTNVSGTDDGINWTSLTIGTKTKAIPAGSSGSFIYEYAVNFEFTKTGTGAGSYTVYFNLKSSTEYNAENIDFSTLRDLIIANGNNVMCSCISQGTLDMNIISTSSNAGDDTILVNSKSSDYYEFYSLEDLTSCTITKLEY